MTRKSNFVWINLVRVATYVLLAIPSFCLNLTAQNVVAEVPSDSVAVVNDFPIDSVGPVVMKADEYIRNIAEFRFTPPPMAMAINMYGAFDSIRTDYLNMATIPIPSSLGPFDDVDGSAMLFGWNNGGVLAFGSMRNLPGLMGIEEGRLQIVQGIGNLTVGLGASMTKYGYFNGLRRSVGVHGSVQWQFNDVLSLRVFGSYYNNTSFTSAAMSGYMGANSYGAALRVDASEKWGFDIGAQRVYNVMSGRWETIPIARPYFKINGKEAIGVDVGGILHEILRSKVGSRGNPTMGPPIPTGYPPVRPREDW
ncbi:MAG: hypothetical protein NC127_07890 [Muribaculum sp.]|nr:hypothetical protein [Muribaculum sp.]